jgi:hypothetical protein
MLDTARRDAPALDPPPGARTGDTLRLQPYSLVLLGAFPT